MLHSLQSQSAEGVCLRDLNQGVGPKSFGLTLLLLSLPSALPVPAPGYSTPFGIALLLVSLQIILGRQSVWLPARMANIRIAPKLAAKQAKAQKTRKRKRKTAELAVAEVVESPPAIGLCPNRSGQKTMPLRGTWGT